MTSIEWIGADPAELRELGRLFQQKAVQLRTAESYVSSRVNAVPWHGSDLQQFHADWNARHRQSLRKVADLLEGQRKILDSNAAAQEAASAAATGRIGGSDGRAQPKPPSKQLVTSLTAALGGDPAAQAKWWGGLTADQRTSLMVAEPGLVLLLTCLSDAERQHALQSAADKSARETVFAKQEVKAELNVNLKVVHIGVDGSASFEKHGDGSVDVTLEGGLSAGVGVKADGVKAGVDLHGSAAVKYHFASQAQADKFVNDLLHAPEPHSLGDGIHMATNSTDYIVDKYGEVFQKYSKNYSTTEFEGSLKGNASVSVGGAGLAADGSVGVRYDMSSKETTYFAEHSVSAHLSAGVHDGSTMSEKFQLTNDSGGHPLSVTLTRSGRVEAGAALPEGLPVQAQSTLGASYETQVSLDLRDPVNAALVHDYITATGAFDAGRSADLYQQISDRSTVTVRSDVVGTTKHGFDLKVVDASITTETSAATSVYVKPPGGQFLEVKPSAKH